MPDAWKRGDYVTTDGHNVGQVIGFDNRGFIWLYWITPTLTSALQRPDALRVTNPDRAKPRRQLRPGRPARKVL